MIKFIGVLAKGGVTVATRSFAEIKGRKELLGSLVEAVKTFSSTTVGEQVSELEFGKNTLLLTESKKGYTLVALIDSAEIYFERLLDEIAREIDTSGIEEAGNIVQEELSNKITHIIDRYVTDTLTPDIQTIKKELWQPLRQIMKAKPKLREIITEIEEKKSKIAKEKSAEAQEKWSHIKSTVEQDEKTALECALTGKFSHACAKALESDSEYLKILSIKMGLLARSIHDMPSPPLSLLKAKANTLSDDNVFARVAQRAVEFRNGAVTLLEYKEVLTEAVEQFEFINDQRHLALAFLFLHLPASIRPFLRFPEFGEQLVDFFQEKSPLIYTDLSSIKLRHKVLKRLYSITDYDVFKDQLEAWRREVQGIINKTSEELGTDFLQHFIDFDTRIEELDQLVLTYSRKVTGYLTLLGVLLQSPVLPLPEMREYLEEILTLYTQYFKAILEHDLPIFTTNLANVFNELALSVYATSHMRTKDSIQKEVEYAQILLNDALTLFLEEYEKLSGYDVQVFLSMTSYLGQLFARFDRTLEKELQLAYLGFQATDIQRMQCEREILPHNYAMLLGHYLISLLSLTIREFEGEGKEELLHRGITWLVDISKFLLLHGRVSRTLLTSLAFYVSRLADSLDERQLTSYSQFVLGLSRIATPSFEKNECDLALVSEPLIEMLVKSGNILNNRDYIQLAEEIYQNALATWNTYGFQKKAKELKKNYRAYT